MKTEHRIYVALLLLAGMGGAYYLTQKNEKQALSEHSAVAASADLPSMSVPKDDVDKLTKIEIKNADKSTVTLEKKGDAWELTAPVAAKANAANVKSLLDNLRDLKAKEVIDRTSAMFDQYDLNDDKGVHVVAQAGGATALDMYFGKSGSRGQMARIAGKDGVYVVSGYSSYLFTREVKNWRETSILKFEDANAIQVEVENKNGAFSFSKNDDKWAATFRPRGKKGELEKPVKKWEKFDEAKVKDLLRAYKALNAEDFAEAGADTGLDAATTEGGVVHIVLKDNAGDFTIKVGKVAKGSSRFASKEGGDGTLYVLSSWSADWAAAAQEKFEKGEDKKAEPPGGMPEGLDLSGMQGMPGMDDE